MLRPLCLGNRSLILAWDEPLHWLPSHLPAPGAGMALASPQILPGHPWGWPRGPWGQSWAHGAITQWGREGTAAAPSVHDRTGKLQPQGLAQAHVPPPSSWLRVVPGGPRAPCLSQGSHPSVLRNRSWSLPARGAWSRGSSGNTPVPAPLWAPLPESAIMNIPPPLAPAAFSARRLET